MRIAKARSQRWCDELQNKLTVARQTVLENRTERSTLQQASDHLAEQLERVSKEKEYWANKYGAVIQGTEVVRDEEAFQKQEHDVAVLKSRLEQSYASRHIRVVAYSPRHRSQQIQKQTELLADRDGLLLYVSPL